MVFILLKLFLYMFICLLSKTLVSGDCVFEKHYGYCLVGSSHIALIQQVKGVLQCDKLCLEYSQGCVAANAKHVKGNDYICELFTELPNNFSHHQLTPYPRGKFLHRKGPAKLMIASCSSSPVQNEEYLCENAYNGYLEPGEGTEWAGKRSDNNVWLMLKLGSPRIVSIIKIWWRCQGTAQYSTLDLRFRDGSVQSVTHQCGNESSWLGCSGNDPEETFAINPVLTTFVHFSGVDCELNDGFNGFREVELWSS